MAVGRFLLCEGVFTEKSAGSGRRGLSSKIKAQTETETERFFGEKNEDAGRFRSFFFFVFLFGK